MHQADPARTLGRIAGLLRPGGWIVVHEPLASPPPRSHPQLGVLATYWALLHEVMEFAGVPRGAIEGLPRSAREAGLDIAEADGFFCTQDPALGLEIHAGSLAAARERAVEAGIAAEMVDDLVARLRAAKNWRIRVGDLAVRSTWYYVSRRGPEPQLPGAPRPGR